MDQPTKIRPVPSNTATTTTSCSVAPLCTSPNPYARDSSRRAIACVACAKAKTRCDKALPSCSRCITKGIKCDPRSTRRTSDNNYRSLSTKKPFTSSKRFATPGILTSSPFPPPRSIPSSRQQGTMRAPSHIDFRTAVKMSQQAAIISGVPKLAPLPTYHSQIVDECYSYDPSPEPDLCRFTPESEQAFSRGTTPQTPADPFEYHEPFSLVDDLDYLDCQPWPTNDLVPVGLGFTNLDMPHEEWMTPTPEPEEMIQANMFALNENFTASLQMHSTLEATSNSTTEPWPAFHAPTQTHTTSAAKASPSLSLDDYSIDSGIVMQGEWTQPQPQLPNSYINMGNMVTSAPYVPKMQGMPDSTPVWEDVFMLGPVAY